MTLLLDALTFSIAFCPSGFPSLPKEEAKVQERKQFTGKDIFLISKGWVRLYLASEKRFSSSY